MNNIRLATVEDIPQMVAMGVKFNNQSSYSRHLKVDEEKIAAIGKQLIEGEGLLVSENQEKITGMIGYIVYRHFMSDEIIAGEVFWWVEPEHRGAGIKLLKEAEDRARQRGAKKMQMIAPTDQVAKVYA